MKITPETVRNLTDFVLLNAYSLSSSGLYKGKAGYVLCLFELSRHFNDSKLEEHAFEILREMLLSQTEKIDFGSGLSGIGYALLYVIRHQFIKADFQELFEPQQKRICSEIRQTENKFQHLDVLPFLMEYDKQAGHAGDTESLIQSILKDSFLISEKTFTKENWHRECRKDVWISFLRSLFRSLFLLEHRNVTVSYDKSLLAKINSDLDLLIRTDRILLPDDIRFYKSSLPALNEKNESYRVVVDPIALKIMDLPTIIRLNIMQSYSQKRFSWPDDPLKGLSDDTLEELLSFRIGRNHRICSFYSGVCRFLLYYLYEKAENRPEVSNRLTELLI